MLVVDEAAMVATRKLAPLLVHAERAGAKVVLVGDDRQFASIDAGGGFRALRLRLGASELTVNRRQVEAWEQRAIDDMRAGNLEQAIAAYAEHDRIRAFEARDDRDRALVSDWWQAHQAGEQPVIYAHHRAQVDQLNSVCQRLRAEAGQLGPEPAGGWGPELCGRGCGGAGRQCPRPAGGSQRHHRRRSGPGRVRPGHDRPDP